MNRTTLKLTALVLLPAAMLTLNSCSSTSNGPEARSESTVIESRNGAMVVDTVTLTATVTAMDIVTRKLTLTSANGYQTTVTAGKSVVNFDQIKVGDQVNVKATESFAVYLRRAGTPASLGAGTAVAVAPRGALPGGMIASTAEVGATITAIDTKTRQVSLQFVDGSTKRLKVGSTVNLKSFKPGDDVTVRIAEALAILVTKS
jgi:hypothetical protein